MAKLSLKAGTTSKSVKIFCQDSSVTTGAGLTGLVFNTASLTAYYIREGANVAVAISLVTATLGTWTSGGFIVVDGTHAPGLYELDLPDAAIAAGAKSVVVYVFGATNMVPVVLEIELTAVDNQDAVRYGMTALPNAAANAAGGLVISAAGALDMDDLAADVDAVETLTATALPNAAPGAANGLFRAGSNAATSITTALTANLTGNVTGNLSGSVGSVTAAVTTTYAIKKNAGLTAFPFVMTDSTTGAPKTGLTVTATRSLDGAAFAGCANAVTELSNGVYLITLAAADLNANTVTLQFTAAGANTLILTLITQS